MKHTFQQSCEAMVKQADLITKDTSMPYDCIDCGWKGTKSQIGGWLGFGGKKEFCPDCGHSEYLVSGEELDAMNQEDETCKLSHPLSCHSNS